MNGRLGDWLAGWPAELGSRALLAGRRRIHPPMWPLPGAPTRTAGLCLAALQVVAGCAQGLEELTAGR